MFLLCLLSGEFLSYGCWILSKAFSASIEINHTVTTFQFVNMVHNTDWFANVEDSLHPWNKVHLVMMYDLFNMLLDSVCLNFAEDFYIWIYRSFVSLKWSESRSVMSDSLQPHGLYNPWNSPGQNTGVGSLSLCQIFPTQGRYWPVAIFSCGILV